MLKLTFVYCAFLFGSLLLSFVVNTFLLRFAKSLGIRNHNNVVIRWSSQSKPSLGGISFYICFLIGLVFCAFVFSDSEMFKDETVLGLFFTLTIAFLMGLSDDSYDTRPKIKLLTQIFCGVLLISTGSHIQLFQSQLFNGILTVFWVIAIMNSINMLDNMDGITSVTSILIIIAISSIYLFFDPGSSTDIYLLSVVLGSLGGFLILNWNPSKMFMGDTGSQFLGMFLAFFSIKYLWNMGAMEADQDIIWRNLTTVLLVFALPIVDTTFVVIKRIRKKQSPMIGGKDHTTHSLSYAGFSDRAVAVIFIILGLISLSLSLIVVRLNITSPYILFSFGLFVLVLLVLFFFVDYSISSSKIENREAKNVT